MSAVVDVTERFAVRPDGVHLHETIEWVEIPESWVGQRVGDVAYPAEVRRLEDERPVVALSASGGLLADLDGVDSPFVDWLALPLREGFELTDAKSFEEWQSAQSSKLPQ